MSFIRIISKNTEGSGDTKFTFINLDRIDALEVYENGTSYVMSSEVRISLDKEDTEELLSALRTRTV